jgi:hypothetical protein
MHAISASLPAFPVVAGLCTRLRPRLSAAPQETDDSRGVPIGVFGDRVDE